MVPILPAVIEKNRETAILIIWHENYDIKSVRQGGSSKIRNFEGALDTPIAPAVAGEKYEEGHKKLDKIQITSQLA